MVGTPGEVNILEELVRDKDHVKRGIYDAKVVSVEFDVTKSKMMPFARIKCQPSDLDIHVNFFSFLYVHTPIQLMFLKHLLPRMIGETVKVKVDYAEFNGTSYRDCRIQLDVESNSPQDER